jgi:hypothetical protein
MKISDNLRPECMPEMVFSIIKMASLSKYSVSDIKNLITFGVSSDEYKKVFEFCKECQFIKIDSQNVVHSMIPSEDLTTFKDFRYSICLSIMKCEEKNDFYHLVEWALENNKEVITANSSDKLSTLKSVNYQKSNREYFLGFRFWFVALGFGVINTKSNSTTLIPSPHVILEQWILKNKITLGEEKVLFKDFEKAITKDFPILQKCIVNNEINDSLSIALRTLHYSGKLKLEYTSDMADIWHLSKTKDSEVFRFTEIKGMIK